MRTVGGGRHFVVDAQVHVWDASPHNQAAPAGEAYATDLLRRHRELDGAGVPPQEVERVGPRGLHRDVFGAGVDRAVLHPVVLDDLFVLGFSPLDWHAEVAGDMPGRFVLCGELDPDSAGQAARGLAPMVRRFDLRGLTLGERRRPVGQLPLTRPWLRRALARSVGVGAGVVHVGVGPCARPAPWHRPPVPAPGRVTAPRVPSWAQPVRAGSARPVRDGEAARVGPSAVDPHQLRELATALPQVQFVLGAGSLPPATLLTMAGLPNTHVLLTEILPWVGSTEFAHAFGELLTAFGPQRLLFGSGYPLVRPGRLLAALAGFRFPAALVGRYPDVDGEALAAVLGGNAARLYRIPLPTAGSAAGSRSAAAC